MYVYMYICIYVYGAFPKFLYAGSHCETPAYAELTPSLRRPSARRVSRSPSAAAYAGAYANLRRLTPAYATSGPIPAVAHREALSKGGLEKAHVTVFRNPYSRPINESNSVITSAKASATFRPPRGVLSLSASIAC